MSHRFRFLVVDDHDDFRSMLQELLELRLKIPVLTARDGLEALNLIQNSSDLYINVVVTDTNMPLLNGIELLREIKDNFSHIKVVVLFSGSESEPHLTEQDVRNMGADFVVDKIKFQELVRGLVREGSDLFEILRQEPKTRNGD